MDNIQAQIDILRGLLEDLEQQKVKSKKSTVHTSLPDVYMANSDGRWHVSDGEWKGTTVWPKK